MYEADALLWLGWLRVLIRVALRDNDTAKDDRSAFNKLRIQHTAGEIHNVWQMRRAVNLSPAVRTIGTSYRPQVWLTGGRLLASPLGAYMASQTCSFSL